MLTLLVFTRDRKRRCRSRLCTRRMSFESIVEIQHVNRPWKINIPACLVILAPYARETRPFFSLFLSFSLPRSLQNISNGSRSRDFKIVLKIRFESPAGLSSVLQTPTLDRLDFGIALRQLLLPPLSRSPALCPSRPPFFPRYLCSAPPASPSRFLPFPTPPATC